jgi:hypothetical protein
MPMPLMDLSTDGSIARKLPKVEAITRKVLHKVAELHVLLVVVGSGNGSRAPLLLVCSCSGWLWPPTPNIHGSRWDHGCFLPLHFFESTRHAKPMRPQGGPKEAQASGNQGPEENVPRIRSSLRLTPSHSYRMFQPPLSESNAICTSTSAGSLALLVSGGQGTYLPIYIGAGRQAWLSLHAFLVCLPCLPCLLALPACFARLFVCSSFLACALRSTVPSPAIAPLMTLPYPNHERPVASSSLKRGMGPCWLNFSSFCRSSLAPVSPRRMESLLLAAHTSEIYQPHYAGATCLYIIFFFLARLANTAPRKKQGVAVRRWTMVMGPGTGKIGISIHS